VHAVVVDHFPHLEIVINETAPRRGAFEFVLQNVDGTETLLWSGIKCGPPRRLKFPEPSWLLDQLKAALE